jgi:hypothetical protein
VLDVDKPVVLVEARDESQAFKSENEKEVRRESGRLGLGALSGE